MISGLGVLTTLVLSIQIVTVNLILQKSKIVGEILTLTVRDFMAILESWPPKLWPLARLYLNSAKKFTHSTCRDLRQQHSNSQKTSNQCHVLLAT